MGVVRPVFSSLRSRFLLTHDAVLLFFSLLQQSAPMWWCIPARFPLRAPSGFSGCLWWDQRPVDSSQSPVALSGDIKEEVYFNTWIWASRGCCLVRSDWRQRGIFKLWGKLMLLDYYYYIPNRSSIFKCEKHKMPPMVKEASRSHKQNSN